MRLIYLIALGSFGCAESALKMGSDDAEMSTSDFSDTGSLPDAGAEDSNELPTHWVLSGALDLEGGEIQPTLSHVEVRIMGAAGSTLCQDGIGIRASDRVEDVPDTEVQIWWSVSMGAVPDGSCLVGAVPEIIPTEMFLGLGPLHPEVQAVMGDELDTLGGTGLVLRSVFASIHEESNVWVFGVAGAEARSPDSLDGLSTDGLAVSEGLWKFEGVYGFPY